MKGNPAVISALEALLAAEYHVNLQDRMNRCSLKVMGAKKISDKFDFFADRAHEFYQAVTKRLLKLGARPSVTVGVIAERSTVTELLQASLAEESRLCELGIAGIQTAVANGDETTAEKLRHIEERHEDHVAWLEQQLALIAGMGEQAYIAEKL